MRRTTSLTALVLGATLLVPTSHASAVGETCRGEAATIVGSGPTITGTEGRDVIVTGKSYHVLAGAGDDLICVTGSHSGGNVIDVEASAGSDVVDSTAMPSDYYLTVVLGVGADTFVGGPGGDSVVAGESDPGAVPPSEAERDLIDTGAGNDDVVSGGPGLTNNDAIGTGSGDDRVTWTGTMGADGLLDAGDGDDSLVVSASGETFRIDLTQQTLTRDGMTAAKFNSFERLEVSPDPSLASLEIVGTEGPDSVDVYGSATLQADLGGGDDFLALAGSRSGSLVDLGAGTDRFQIRSWDDSVDLDLTKGSLLVDGVATASVAGVEKAYVSARESRVTGNREANTIFVAGCLTTVYGGSGKDDITHSNFDFDVEEGYDCDHSRATLYGGSGNDHLDGGVRADRIYGGSGKDHIDTGPAREGINKAWGGRGNDVLTGGGASDVLLGGAGRDRADGERGRDRCTAEIEKACER